MTKGERWAAVVRQYCRGRGWPDPEPELRFHPSRKWRWDLGWKDRLLAVEFQGGVWTNGGHTRGKGYSDDMEKYATAAVLGWRLIPITYQQLERGFLWELLDTEFTEKK